MTSLSLELTIPAFLQVLRQNDQHNRWVQTAIRGAIEEIGEHDAKSMVDLLETETTNLLQNVRMDPSEEKLLQDILSCINNLKEKNFASVFCNEKIVLPERLVDCLERNSAFVRLFTKLRKLIEAPDSFYVRKGPWHGFIYSSTIQEYEYVMRLFPGMLKLEHILFGFEEYEKLLLQFRLLLEYKASLEEIRNVRICPKLCYAANRDHGSLTRLCSFFDELKSKNLLSKKTDEFFVDTLFKELYCNEDHVQHSAFRQPFPFCVDKRKRNMRELTTSL